MPRSRLAVQLAAVRGKMADVGNVDAQRPVTAVLVARQRHGIVEVAGVHGVDGDNEFAGEVLSAGKIVLAKAGRRLACLLLDLVGKLVGQAEGADDRQRIDAGLAVRPEYFGDDALAAFFLRREAQHVQNDLVAGPGSPGSGVADADAVAEDRAIDADEGLTIALVIGADELARGPLQHLDDLAVGADVGQPRAPHDAHQHFVAGGGVAGVFGADADLGAGAALDEVRPDVARAGGRFAEDAGDGRVAGRGADGVVLARFDAALLEQIAQRPAEVGVLFGGERRACAPAPWA